MPTNDFAALVRELEEAARETIYASMSQDDRAAQRLAAETELADARAALLAYGAGVEQQLATIEAWLRDGHDENLSDRWICTPNGSEGPVVARGYEFEDIERPNLSMLADALATRPTEARES